MDKRKKIGKGVKKALLELYDSQLIKKNAIVKSKKEGTVYFFCKCLVCELTVVVLSGRTDRQ